MSKRDTASEYADEQRARLASIGLDSEKRIAANENMPSRSELYGEVGRWVPMSSIAPGVLTLAEMIEHGRCDGWADVRLNRPESASIRFIEARLHYENMERFAAYCDAYTKAWKAGVK